MKHFTNILAPAVALLSLSITLPATAQTAPQAAPAPSPLAARPINSNPLGVTPAQDKEIQTRRAKFKKAEKLVENNKNLTDAQKKAKIDKLETEAETDIKAILTPHQRQLASEIQQKATIALKLTAIKKQALEDETNYKILEKQLLDSFTLEQRQKLAQINDDTQAEIAKINSDSSLSSEQKEAKKNEAKEKMQNGHQSIFTSEQVKLAKKISAISDHHKQLLAEFEQLAPIVIPTDAEVGKPSPKQ